MKTIKAAVISNGIEGLQKYFNSSKVIEYTFLEITKNFNPNLDDFSILIVPNGSDNIAMLKIKEKVSQFLENGNVLFCFDGWFTDWIPNNQWIMSNDIKTIDQRYTSTSDSHNLLENVNINELIFNNNISGWWSCGYIKSSSKAEVILQDTLGRPIVVLDEKSTNGIIFLTASGPLGDMGIDNKVNYSNSSLRHLFQNVLFYVAKKINNS